MNNQSPKRRSNSQRTAEMREKLIATARELFVSQGYMETSTPDIVAAAAVTRGALYHHFTDKKDLFEAVIRTENESVASEINQQTTGNTATDIELITGAAAFFAAMQVPGRCRLLLVEGPAILGFDRLKEIDDQNSAKSLLEGLQAATPKSPLSTEELTVLASVLAAAFDRGALLISRGTPAATVLSSFTFLLSALFPGPDG